MILLLTFVSQPLIVVNLVTLLTTLSVGDYGHTGVSVGCVSAHFYCHTKENVAHFGWII